MTVFRNTRVASVPVRLLLERDRRLDGEVYLTDGFQYRYHLGALDCVETVEDLARVWQPSRLKGVQVHSGVGVPFLAATQAFDIRPRSRKWLSPLHTPDLESRYVKNGTILVTCSGHVGNTMIAYHAHEEMVLSHDLLRVVPYCSDLAGYLYAYFRTRQGRAVMQSSQYGNIIKHLEPEHLNAVPVPRFSSAFEAGLHADMRVAYGWRDEALELELSAEADYAAAIGVDNESTLDDLCIVQRSRLFSGRRRLDAYHYNAIAGQITGVLGDSGSLSNVVDGILLPQRFTRKFVPGGVPFIGSEDIFKVNPHITKFLSPTSMVDPSRYLVEPGWLLVARSGQLYGTNGSVTLADEWHVDKIVSEHVIRIRPARSIRSGYLKACLGHPTIGRPLIIRNAFGTSVPEIDPDDLGTVPTPRIGRRLEDEIADKTETASALREKARKRESMRTAQ